MDQYTTKKRGGIVFIWLSWGHVVTLGAERDDDGHVHGVGHGRQLLGWYLAGRDRGEITLTSTHFKFVDRNVYLS